MPVLASQDIDGMVFSTLMKITSVDADVHIYC